MQRVCVTVFNELASLRVLQAAVRAFSEEMGAPLAVTQQMELVTEEITANIIKYEYLPGQREQIEVELSCQEKQLSMEFRFKGIPFDTAHLEHCGEVCPNISMNDEVRGVGLYLVRQCVDTLEYRNLGKHGQQIRIQRRFESLGKLPEAAAPQEDQAAAAASPTEVVIRRMQPEESAAVSRLAYFAYRYSYVYDHIYDPNNVQALNREGGMISYVSVDAAQAEILGHCALIPERRSQLDELGVAFVHPHYRGGGYLNQMTEVLLEESRRRGVEGVFAMAVAGHPFSQKAAAKHRLKESALLVSRVQPVFMSDIREQSTARETLFLMARLFGDARRGRYYAPENHRAMLTRICAHLEIFPEFVAPPQMDSVEDQGELTWECDHYQAAHIHLVRYGSDSLAEVRRLLRNGCLDRLETIYLYLPLKQSATAVMTGTFEKMGFFFAGLQPARAGNDALILQYLNNQRYDYRPLKAGTPFGQQLIDYVRRQDPNGRTGDTDDLQVH
jgi:serine/threonine-protein kinase RsbW